MDSDKASLISILICLGTEGHVCGQTRSHALKHGKAGGARGGFLGDANNRVLSLSFILALAFLAGTFRLC